MFCFCLFVLQWLFWGLERSTEDHICSVRGPVLRELDWLWQSLGRSEEWLDQPGDQQVRPGSMLSQSVPSAKHIEKYFCSFSMHDATYCVAQEYNNTERMTFVPLKAPLPERNLRSTDRLGRHLRSARAICAVLARVHLYKVMLTWWRQFCVWLQLLRVFFFRFVF